jgi:hypothetical protein
MFGLRPRAWFDKARTAAGRAIEFDLRGRLLPGRVRHVHGPTAVEYGVDQLITITVVRNGRAYLPAFLEHHRRLGVVHMVFLDNGSTDGTLDLLRGEAGVTVLATDAPYAKYENTMKRYLADRFSAGRWNLCVDIDEHFDYPYSHQLPLSGFLGYLNARGYTAVVAQMLDLFAATALVELPPEPDGIDVGRYDHYDTAAVDRRAYEWSDVSNPDVHMHWGGIRRAVFGTDNGLTKAALVNMDGRVQPFLNWHHALGARVADVTGVLRHYPFTAGFRDKVLDAVASRRYGGTTTGEYEKYAAALARDPALTLARGTARRYIGLEPLIDDGFIVATEDYRRWLQQYGSRQSGDRSPTGALT